MFLEDKLREKLPRQLQQVGIICLSYLPGEPTAVVIFWANKRPVEFEVDVETGLTDAQFAHLCVAL
jgi:hypothetical protein